MTGSSELVIAGTAAAVERREPAFVESCLPDDAWTTYSNILDPDACSTIDRDAYGRARTWYRREDDGSDPTSLSGTSLGRAFELRATAMLVAYNRARIVLTRLAGPGSGATVQIRDAGEEWALAAHDLGIAVTRNSRIGRSLVSIVPDTAVRGPSQQGRILALAGRLLEPHSVDLVLSESPRWVGTYHRALLSRWPAVAVNPGTRLLLAALLHRQRLRSSWLIDSTSDDDCSTMADVAESSHLGDAILRAAFIRELPKMAGWAARGRSLQGRVAVATQDVTPAARSALLGFQAGGGRVVTLEHGISGGYAEQVHTIADHLGVWGPIQAAYHRDAGPPALDVVELGWPRLQAAAVEPRGREDPRLDVAYFGQPATPLSAGSWPEDAVHSRAVIEEYAERHPNRRVAVKLHPATRDYHGIENVQARARVISGDSLSIIRQARVVAAATSTTALEAMAIGRPVIRLINRGYIGPVDFLRDSGAVVSVGDVDALEAAAEQLLSDPRAYRRAVDLGRAYAATFITGLDRPGSAEERLVGLIRGLLAQ